MSRATDGSYEDNKHVWKWGPFDRVDIFFGVYLYMRRWNLRLPGGFSIKLHMIALPDHGELHDHPWKFISVILRGGYEQETAEDSKLYRPGMPNIRLDPTKQHKVTPIIRPTWTIGFYWPKEREWGFWIPDDEGEHWIPHHEYDDLGRTHL